MGTNPVLTEEQFAQKQEDEAISAQLRSDQVAFWIGEQAVWEPHPLNA